jgi:hypothetical protein
MSFSKPSISALAAAREVLIGKRELDMTTGEIGVRVGPFPLSQGLQDGGLRFSRSAPRSALGHDRYDIARHGFTSFQRGRLDAASGNKALRARVWGNVA